MSSDMGAMTRSFTDKATACRNGISTLPITPFLSDITARLKESPSRFLVLTAETAAGKSTAIPPAFLDAFPGRILMLEPRRLAAAATAMRVSELIGEKCGETAGYRIHLDSCVSAETRFEVITEAVLVRMMQEDPSLEGVSVVILDEFHERSIYTDLSLAFLKETVQLRDDLHVLIMSATIDTEKVCSFLDCGVHHVPGRQFPVDISYFRNCTEDPVQDAAAAVKSIPIDESVLAFLPGIRELRKVEALLQDFALQTDSELYILHSSIPVQQQRKILKPSDQGRRRIILSSSVAETSVTVPGITYVIDSGLARVSRLNTAAGMNRLVTENESQFSADQRAGRAGRLGPGKCIRLWNENNPRTRNAPVEIQCTELIQLVLECSLWGARTPGALEWLDPPPASSWQAASQFLVQSGCIHQDGSITEKGKAVLKAGVHPRIACTALEALNGNKDAVHYAALYGSNGTSGSKEASREHMEKEVNRLETHLMKRISNMRLTFTTPELPGPLCLLAGFPDRAAISLGDGMYKFQSGRQASVPEEDRKRFSSASWPEWIIAIDADAGERTGRIYTYEPVPASCMESFRNWLDTKTTTENLTEFTDGTCRKLKKSCITWFGKIKLKEQNMQPDPADITAAWCNLASRNGLRSLPWDDSCDKFLARADFYMRHSGNAQEGVSLEKQLAETAEEWLVPFITAGTSLSAETVLNALRWKLNGDDIDRKVPEKLLLPNGRNCRIRYETTDSTKGPEPVGEIIIQQLFGCFETPRILGVPVLLKLLSPARRPLQVTRDLENFWTGTWTEICKEMKGRYPKHNWDYRKPEE